MGKSGTPETSRIATTFKDPRVEMGRVGMDFIVGLPRTQARYDSIWVIVDRLTKVAHFTPVKTTYSGAKLAELYMSRIMCLYGVRRRSCQIEVPSSHPNFGRNFMSPWILS
jgi:hypothetical protein